MGKLFKLCSNYQPAGDQPRAIEQIIESFRKGVREQVLLGVTGSGKTFTMAHVIEQMELPVLVLAPNKTLAAQLYSEFRELFPNNAVEYFVSYYDYYQPEAYIPATDTFIEKDSAINEQIDRMRHSATRSLFERKDVIIVSSVSCIYGLGSPEAYEGMMVLIRANSDLNRDHLLRELVRIQYTRNNVDFHRGTFRVRGDVVEVFPPYEDQKVIRIEFFGDFVDKISWIDPLTGEVFGEVDQIPIFPGSHYVTGEEKLKLAIKSIQEELQDRLSQFQRELKFLESQRLEQRTYYDIEMMEEMGFCSGIENYSRHLTGRSTGEPPPTLLEYFSSQFLTLIDESHVTVPQIGGMYRGDRSRKMTLVDHGFRLPSALDNRPLNFSEFEKIIDKVIYVSATPGEYEMNRCREDSVVEQIIRPTGLIDPVIRVHPARHQVDHLLSEIRNRLEKSERVLVTTLTKRSAEDLTDYYQSLGVPVKYLHSDIKTVERTEIVRDLRLGVFQVLVGINLLREGLDIPEVSLVAILDADKEGFLRSERSLIQTIGRAARNINGTVFLYADQMTQSMQKAISETERRRTIQMAYNKENSITPQSITKAVSKGLMDLYSSGTSYSAGQNTLTEVSTPYDEYIAHPNKIPLKIKKLKKKMRQLADQLEFEQAASLRDEIRRLELIDLSIRSGEVGES